MTLDKGDLDQVATLIDERIGSFMLSVKDERIRLHDDLTMKDAEIARLTADVERLTGELKEAKVDLQEAKNLQVIISAKDAEIAALRDRLAASENDHEHTKAQLTTQGECLYRMTKERDAAQAEVVEIKGKLDKEKRLKETAMSLFTEAKDAVEAHMKLFKNIAHCLCNVAQIFDGWHCDTAWTTYDTEIRKLVSDCAIEVDGLLKEWSAIDAPPPPPAGDGAKAREKS